MIDQFNLVKHIQNTLDDLKNNINPFESVFEKGKRIGIIEAYLSIRDYLIEEDSK